MLNNISEELKKVTIATVSYGSSTSLKTFLDSVKEHYNNKIKVIVADNLVADKDLKKLIEKYNVKYLAMSRNIGYGAAINRASEAVTPGTEWLLVCNPDITLHKNSIENLIFGLLNDPKTVAAGPKIIDLDGKIYPSARAIPSLSTGIGHAIFKNIWKNNPWSQKYYENDKDIETRYTGWLSGACFLIKTDVFAKLGGFDEEYFMYFEDVDLGYRIGNIGKKSIYVPEAVVTHVGAHSTTKSATEMQKEHHRSAVKFLNKKYPKTWQGPIRLVLKLALALRSNLAK